MRKVKLVAACLSLLAVLALGWLPSISAEEDEGGRCNCKKPNTNEYGKIKPPIGPDSVCVVDPDCWIIIDWQRVRGDESRGLLFGHSQEGNE
jgi:hypothetical protein